MTPRLAVSANSRIVWPRFQQEGVIRPNALAPAALLALAACGGKPEPASPETVETHKVEAPVIEAAIEVVPVIVGADGPVLDACGALGQIVSGGHAVPIRAAPRDKAPEVAALEDSRKVMVCDSHGSGDGPETAWLGIVFSDGDLRQCGVNSPIASKSPYAGPCSSGWVPAEAAEIVAG